MTQRIGMGFDVHKLVSGRPLVLGGVTIDHPKGLDGHSDADVLIHAICDALLGAAAMGDIGRMFPDNDEQYEGISSIVLLERVCERLHSKGFKPVNVDVTVAAEAPKLAPHANAMRVNIAEALGIGVNFVSVKATTTEGLGYTGRGEGMAAWAVAAIETIDWQDGNG